MDSEVNSLRTFDNPTFGEIRALTIDGAPWFVAADVCKALGHTNPTMAIAGLDEDERAKLSLGRQGETNCVNEAGLYTLVIKSHKPEAKAFRRWITHEVLPSIRKNGGYIAGQKDMTDAELMAAALLVADRQIKARDTRIRELETQAAANAPKVLYADAVAGSEGGMLIREFAKFLRQNGVDIGEKRLFEDLRRRGFLIRAEGRDKNKPTQKAMDMCLFTVKESAISMPLGVTITKTTPLLTGKGRQYFLNLYLSGAETTA